jgi:hypothetical protein
VWGARAKVQGVVLEVVSGGRRGGALTCSRAPNDDDVIVVTLFAVVDSRGRGVWEGAGPGGGEWRMKKAGGLTCLQGFHPFACPERRQRRRFCRQLQRGCGERGYWGWSVVSGDGGVGDLLGLALLLLPRMSALARSLAPLVRSPLLPLRLRLRLLMLVLPPLVRVRPPCARLDLWWWK